MKQTLVKGLMVTFSILAISIACLSVYSILTDYYLSVFIYMGLLLALVLNVVILCVVMIITWNAEGDMKMEYDKVSINGDKIYLWDKNNNLLHEDSIEGLLLEMGWTKGDIK